jgi:hypothetical protein
MSLFGARPNTEAFSFSTAAASTTLFPTLSLMLGFPDLASSN